MVHESQNRAEDSLYTAAVTNDIPLLTRCIEEGADIHAKLDDHGRNSLLVAAQFLNAEAVLALLERGAEPDIQDCNYNTAMHVAAERGDKPSAIEIIKILLSKGASASKLNWQHLTPKAVAQTAGYHEASIAISDSEKLSSNCTRSR